MRVGKKPARGFLLASNLQSHTVFSYLVGTKTVSVHPSESETMVTTGMEATGSSNGKIIRRGQSNVAHRTYCPHPDTDTNTN